MELSFPIEPASNAALWFIIPISLLLIGILGLMGFMAFSLYNLRVAVAEDAIEIKGDLYGRRIPLSDLMVEQARIVDLDQDREYALRLRTNGIGLPGYQSGWFKMRNGEKALAFVTQKRTVVRIPTRDGYTLLLSVEGADEFIQTLQGVSVTGP